MLLILGATGLLLWKYSPRARHESGPVDMEPQAIASLPPVDTHDDIPATTTKVIPDVPSGTTYASAPPAVAVLADENEALLLRFDSRLMNNPELEEFMRRRLWLALDQLNNPLIKKLGLTQEETGKFKALIVDNLVAATQQAGEAAEQGPAAAKAALDDALALQQADYDVQLQQLLGDDRFRKYVADEEDYSQFNGIKFLDGNDPPLADERVEQILGLMQNERKIVNAAVLELRESTSGPQPLSADERFQVRQLIDTRVYTRIKSWLPSNELAAFARFQSQQLDAFSTTLVLETGGRSPQNP